MLLLSHCGNKRFGYGVFYNSDQDPFIRHIQGVETEEAASALHARGYRQGLFANADAEA